MKKYIAESHKKAGAFYKEGLDWHDLHDSAKGYYDVQHLYYKEDRADDYLIDAMLRLVGSINLSLSPNTDTVLTIKSKESDNISISFQMNFDFAPATYRVVS